MIEKPPQLPYGKRSHSSAGHKTRVVLALSAFTALACDTGEIRFLGYKVGAERAVGNPEVFQETSGTFRFPRDPTLIAK